jgi:putative membrane protein
MIPEIKTNKDLILRERLALQRTNLANQTTFLAYLRTSLYFFIAGISADSILEIDFKNYIEIVFYVISALLFIVGIINYFTQKNIIIKNENNIGNYKTDYYE